ncbi:MAG: hypothetical protein QW667_03035 [Candidatus Bathyarchaeia archaeon]
MSIYVALYTISAHYVADRWALDSGWRYAGTINDASFFPWPRGPKGILLPVITKMNPTDEFIYLYLIKTGILILICLGLWLLTIVYCFRAILPLIKAWKLDKSKARI